MSGLVLTTGCGGGCDCCWTGLCALAKGVDGEVTGAGAAGAAGAAATIEEGATPAASVGGIDIGIGTGTGTGEATFDPPL